MDCLKKLRFKMTKGTINLKMDLECLEEFREFCKEEGFMIGKKAGLVLRDFVKQQKTKQQKT